MNVNQLNLQHSLRTHLASVMGVNVVWVYDGVTLPNETAKPFMTVKQMQNNNEIVAKVRDAVETTHRFQIGLFAATATDRSRLQERVKRTLLFDKIPLIDLDQPTRPVVGFFYAEVRNETPIDADSTDAKNMYHRIYFDVEIDVHYYG